MAKRIIPLEIKNEYVKGSGVMIGASGSHDDVILEMHFGEMWEGTTKSIVWKNSKGLNPVITLLTADLLKLGETDVYLVPVPAEPKEYAGDLIMAVRGVIVSENVESSATLTAFAKFRVLESMWDYNASAAQDVTPSQAEMLQAEIDAMLEDVAAVIETAAGLEDLTDRAERAAEGAEGSASSALESAESAQNAAQKIENMRVGAITLEAGSDATVTKSEDFEGNLRLDFGIPQGIQGLQGPVGPQGPTGPQGPEGSPSAVIRGETGIFAMNVDESGHLIVTVNDEEDIPPIHIDSATGHLLYTVG